MYEYLSQLSKELREISREIAVIKEKVSGMEHGPERKKFKQRIKDRQWQALFYIDTIENLAEETRTKGKA